MIKKFGRYELLERISVGGMAEVFRGRVSGAAGFEKIVAIKRILPQLSDDKDFIGMFIDEAKISAKLNHSNIGQVFEFGKIEETYFIAMEYIHGNDLKTINQVFRSKGGTMPVPMAIRIILEVCHALEYAHSKKDSAGRPLHIIHRDVSPPNILISFEGAVKLIDFGIAKALSRSGISGSGNLKGKWDYMSPEMVSGKSIDHRSDIFALGTVLWELVVGRRLFQGSTELATMENVRRADVPLPSALNPSVPKALEAVLLQALARDREERFQQAESFHEALERFAQSHNMTFSTKQLSRWMKTTFSADLKRAHAHRGIAPDRQEPLDPFESDGFTVQPTSPETPSKRPVRRTIAGYAAPPHPFETEEPSPKEVDRLRDALLSKKKPTGGRAFPPRAIPAGAQMKGDSIAFNVPDLRTREDGEGDGPLEELDVGATIISEESEKLAAEMVEEKTPPKGVLAALRAGQSLRDRLPALSPEFLEGERDEGEIDHQAETEIESLTESEIDDQAQTLVREDHSQERPVPDAEVLFPLKDEAKKVVLPSSEQILPAQDSEALASAPTIAVEEVSVPGLREALEHPASPPLPAKGAAELDDGPTIVDPEAESWVKQLEQRRKLQEIKKQRGPAPAASAPVPPARPAPKPPAPPAPKPPAPAMAAPAGPAPPAPARPAPAPPAGLAPAPPVPPVPPVPPAPVPPAQAPPVEPGASVTAPSDEPGVSVPPDQEPAAAQSVPQHPPVQGPLTVPSMPEVESPISMTFNLPYGGDSSSETITFSGGRIHKPSEARRQRSMVILILLVELLILVGSGVAIFFFLLDSGSEEVETQPTESALQPKSKARSLPRLEVPEARPQPLHEARPQPRLEARPQPLPEARPQTRLETRPQAAPRAKPQPASRAKPQPRPRAKPQAAPRAKPQPSSRAKPQPASRAKPQPASRAKPQPRPRAKPQPRPRAKPQPRPKGRAPAGLKTRVRPGKEGYLLVNSRPWARIFIDGKDTGRNTPVAHGSPLKLKMGTHKVTLQVGSKRFTYTVTIRTGETVKLIKQLPVSR